MIGYSPILGASMAGVVPTRVYVVDDHPLIRRGLALLISGEYDLVVCGDTEDATRAIQDIKKIVPDVVVVDIALHGHSGLALIKEIKALGFELGIVALSVHDEKIYGLRALEAGARGYVNKSDPLENVIDAIRQVHAGGIFVSKDLAGQLLRRIRKGS